MNFNLRIAALCTSLALFCCCAKNSNVKAKRGVDTDSLKNIVLPADTAYKPFAEGKTPMNEFIGVNGFHEDNIDFLKASGFLRAYLATEWFTGDNPDDLLIFQGSRPGWFFDDAFKIIKNAGIKINLCLLYTPKNLRAGNQDGSHNEDKPVNAQGINTTEASSYSRFANVLFQVAARYGKAKVDASKLRVKSDQITSGLDLIDYIEVWNEPDKDWKGPAAYFSPEEYAAMLSISYDKIKEADPGMKVAMAGLTTLGVDYLKKMKAWFEANRADKKFAADVINMHAYAFNNKIVWGKTWPFFGPAETPEDAGFRTKSQELVDYCKQNLPGAEIWISEFGWDTNPNSVLCPKPISGLSIKEVQARWIARAYLEFAAAGIDKAQVFTLLDPSQDYIDTQFGTSGLVERTNFGAKKPSWYYTYTMKNILNNMVYIGEDQQPNSSIKVYKFREKNSNKGAYAIWSNSSSNTTIKDFVLSINKNASICNKTELTDQKTNGEKSVLSITNNTVMLDVSEKPVFVNVNFIR